MRAEEYKKMFENELSHAWYLGTRQLMINYVIKYIKKSAKVLDAGCGTGGTIKLLEKAGYKNVIGIDNSQEAIKFTKKRGIKKIVSGTINNLPFPDKTFDAIICLDVLYHQNVDPSHAIGEFRRVLKTGGFLYIQEPAYHWLRGSHDIAIQTARRFSSKSLKYLAEINGFNVKKCTYFNAVFFLPILVKRLIERKRNISDVKPLPKILNNIFLVILKTEGFITSYVNLPFGLSVVAIAQSK